jgi:hypothetical protein
VLQRELLKQATDTGNHTCGYNIVLARRRQSSDVTAIGPTEQVSDGPDMGATSLLNTVTYLR